jgi:hypothetical protein
MGTVIAIDFKRRGRAHASAPQEAPPVSCLAWLYVPLLVYWTVWLPLAYWREGSHDVASSGGADGQ